MLLRLCKATAINFDSRFRLWLRRKWDRVDATLVDARFVARKLYSGGSSGPAYIARALGTIARSGNVSELARRIGMIREGLYKALSADGNPSFAPIVKVADALGLKIHFEPAA